MASKIASSSLALASASCWVWRRASFSASNWRFKSSTQRRSASASIRAACSHASNWLRSSSACLRSVMSRQLTTSAPITGSWSRLVAVLSFQLVRVDEGKTVRPNQLLGSVAGHARYGRTGIEDSALCGDKSDGIGTLFDKCAEPLFLLYERCKWHRSLPSYQATEKAF